jgi:putative membrane protein
MISDIDKPRIVEAIRAAEEKTAGEIFCVIAHACGDYHLVPIAWAAMVALAVPLPLIYFTIWPAGIIYLLQLAAFIVVALVFSLPAIRFRTCRNGGCGDRRMLKRCISSWRTAFTSRSTVPAC